MKKIAIAAAVAMSLSAPASAEYLYGFGNVSVNALDWSNGSEERAAHHKDFVYLELEGGAGFSWGELYGFFDVENVQEDSSDLRTAYKGSAAYKLGDSGFRAYTQHYATDSSGFSASNTVLGGQYRFEGEGWFFAPFIGSHYTISNPSWTTGFSGFNGGMAGWAGVYNFSAFNQNFWVSNWHEMEFSRKDAYIAASGEEKGTSMNGALGFWWNATQSITAGVQYRYADKKLGSADNLNAVIYSMRYNF